MTVPARGEPGTARVVWLVDGDDPILVGEAVDGLVEELVGDGDRSLAVEDFRGDEVDLAAVADACQTPPFLAARRVVVIRDVGRWKTEEVAPLLSYLEDPLPSTALILGAGAGTLAPKLAALVKAKGHVVQTKVDGRAAKGWLRDRVRRSTVDLDGAAEALVEAHLGEDVSRLSALLEVLGAAYEPGVRLGPAEVEPYLGAAGSVTPWDFTDAIDTGDQELALGYLSRLLGAGERHPLVVLATLHRHVQSVLRVSSPGITTEAQAAVALGIAAGRSTYPAKKALASARRLRPTGVAEAIRLVAAADLALKGAQDWPADLVLEVLVARLCRLSRASGRSRSAPRRAPAPTRSASARGV